MSKHPEIPKLPDEDKPLALPPSPHSSQRVIKKLLGELRVQTALPKERRPRIVTKPGPRSKTQRLMFELLLQGCPHQDIADAANISTARLRQYQSEWMTDGSLLRQVEARRRSLHAGSMTLMEKAQHRVDTLLDSPDETVQLAAAKLAATMYQNQEQNVLKQEGLGIEAVNAKTSQELVDVFKSYVQPPRPQKSSTPQLTVDLELDNSSGLIPEILVPRKDGV